VTFEVFETLHSKCCCDAANKRSTEIQSSVSVPTGDRVADIENKWVKLSNLLINWGRGGTVVKVLHYKSEGRWFDPNWCHWNFSLT